MTEQRKAVIKNADMSEDMQQDAVDISSTALSKYNIEKVCFKIPKKGLSKTLFYLLSIYQFVLHTKQNESVYT